MQPRKDLKSHALKDKVRFVSPGVYTRDIDTAVITLNVPITYTVQVERTVSNELLHPYNMFNDDWIRVVKERTKSDMLKELVDKLYDNGLIEIVETLDDNTSRIQMNIKVVGI